LRHRRAFIALAALVMITAALTLAGCGGKKVVKPSEESVRASRALGALQDMERAYEARDIKGVMEHVSQDLRGGYAEYMSHIRKDVEAFKKIQLETRVDRVEETADEVRLVFHWNCRWTTDEGKTVEGRGNSVFVYTDKGTVSLVSVTGDSPFGVVK